MLGRIPDLLVWKFVGIECVVISRTVNEQFLEAVNSKDELMDKFTATSYIAVEVRRLRFLCEFLLDRLERFL